MRCVSRVDLFLNFTKTKMVSLVKLFHIQYGFVWSTLLSTGGQYYFNDACFDLDRNLE